MTILILLFSCSCDVISPNDECVNNDSKLKKETRYNWDSSLELEVISYDYYADGLLKHISKNHWEQEFFYNANKDIEKEIIYEGSSSIDSVYYKYNNKNLLILKETSHKSSISYRNTIDYKYNDRDMLIETIDKRGNQNTVYKSIYKYDSDLLVKKSDFADDLLIRTFEYEYDKKIKTKETSFMNGNIEYTYIFKYKKGLLVKIEGYFSNLQSIDSEEELIYNKKNQLVVRKVKVPSFSSHMNYVVYYEYF